MVGGDDDFAISMLFSDPSPNGHINQRINNAFILNLDKVDLVQAETDVLLDRLIRLSKKLAMTWRHLDSYRRIEGELVSTVAATPIRVGGKRVGFDCSDEPYAEFDGFLVQLKSALDYLAQVPGPILGPSWNPRSFGEKGERIIKLLKNAPSKYQDGISIVCETIRDSQPWLQDVIAVRDRINHYQRGGVPYEFFKVEKVVRDGREILLVPMWSDVASVRDALGDVWRRLMCFCEAFIGSVLYLRLKPYWAVRYTQIADEGESERDSENESTRWEFALDLEALKREELGNDHSST